MVFINKLKVHINSRPKVSFNILRKIMQALTTTQFYLFGRKHCTKTGYDINRKSYCLPDILEDANLDLSDKVYMITGANTGIGREIATFLATKQAAVYIVCRNGLRAETARKEIVDKAKNDKVHVLIGDCGVESDVRRIWTEFVDQRKASSGACDDTVQLNGLVCNAGALTNEKMLTSEGVESTFATHLLFGTYLLGSLALPTLHATTDSRLVVVSSGGMYNTKFPSWSTATSTGGGSFDGQMAYAYAKRGQVLLCEQWAKQHEGVKIVSCHPGWTITEGVQAAYGESKKYLEPLRSLWEGSEGIAWLLATPDVSQIEDGAFYLDRSPQPKHLPGVLFGENEFTKNTPEEVEEMMTKLQQWSCSETRPSARELDEALARTRPLVAMSTPIDLQAFMGTWYVLASIPTPFEVGASDCLEEYVWNAAKERVNVTFTFTPPGASSPSQFKQRGTVQNAPLNTHWAINPKLVGLYLPLGLGYLVLHLAEDGSFCVVGVPDRSYLWVMTRARPSAFKEAGMSVVAAYDKTALETSPSVGQSVDDSEQSEKRRKEWDMLHTALQKAEVLGFDLSKVQRVPWSEEEPPVEPAVITQNPAARNSEGSK